MPCASILIPLYLLNILVSLNLNIKEDSPRHLLIQCKDNMLLVSKYRLTILSESSYRIRESKFLIHCPLNLTIPQIFTRARGPLAASAHEVDTAQVRVLIGCVFVEIVIESETCHICRTVLLTI
jgi:hypothetical protein